MPLKSTGSTAGRGDLHARLERMEEGLFRAVYGGELNPDDAGPDGTWPDAHIGDNLEGVKT